MSDSQPSMGEAARLRAFLLGACARQDAASALAGLAGARGAWLWIRLDGQWQHQPAHPQPPADAWPLLDPAAQAPLRIERGGVAWWRIPLPPAPEQPPALLLLMLDPGAAPPDGELLAAAGRFLLAHPAPEAGGEGAERLRAVLEHSERLSQLGKMAAGIAHEVGNPLAGISSIVQGLLARTQDETARERLKLVKEQVGRINAIIRQLVEYSRPSAERPRPTDLNELVRDTARLMRFEPRARGVDLTLELDDRLPYVPVRAHQIQQVFLNLLHNAIDATEGLGWRSVRVHSGRQGEFAVFTVSDNGSGIAQADLARLFDPFFTTKEPGRGTGLGLWICQGIVEALGGDLAVEGAPGQGARVTVRIRIPHEAEYSGR